NAISITPVASCGTIANQTIFNATSGGLTSTCSGGTLYDVWYKVVVPTGVHSLKVAVTSPGSSLTSANTFIEAYNATTCGTATAANTLGCANIGAGLNYSVGNSGTYYFRIFTTSNPNVAPASNWTFSLCVSYQPPSNDLCASAVTLTPATTFTATTNQTLTQ